MNANNEINEINEINETEKLIEIHEASIGNIIARIEWIKRQEFKTIDTTVIEKPIEKSIEKPIEFFKSELILTQQLYQCKYFIRQLYLLLSLNSSSNDEEFVIID